MDGCGWRAVVRHRSRGCIIRSCTWSYNVRGYGVTGRRRKKDWKQRCACMWWTNWSASSHISRVLLYPPSTLQLHLYITNVTLCGHVYIVCMIPVCGRDGGCSASDPVTLIIITLPAHTGSSTRPTRSEPKVPLLACIVWCVVISQVTAAPCDTDPRNIWPLYNWHLRRRHSGGLNSFGSGIG